MMLSLTQSIKTCDALTLCGRGRPSNRYDCSTAIVRSQQLDATDDQTGWISVGK